MIDIHRLRDDPDGVKTAVARRGDGVEVLDRILALDGEHRAATTERDDVRARINALSKQVGALRRDGKVDDAEAAQAESKALGERQRALDERVDGLAAQVTDLLLHTANLPADAAPDGADEHDNVVLRVEPSDFDEAAYGDHQRVAHWDIGAHLGMLDMERGAKLSGSMFAMYRGAGATLNRALCQLALDRNADAFEEIRPPTMVLTETMVSTGHLPKFEEDAYHLERDDLWAIPTAEVPLTSLARNEILDEAELPTRMMAHTSCFRREAGSAGRDTRGLLRVHEFDKVELLAYLTPEQAPEVHADVLARAEALLVELGLTYRVLDLCAGDLGGSSARTWDLEVFAPGVDRWLEVSSVSWFTDYQARRANVRYRPSDPEDKQPRFVHTVNGSGLAVPRVLAALLEVHRQPDGTVAIPEALHLYTRGATVIG